MNYQTQNSGAVLVAVVSFTALAAILAASMLTDGITQISLARRQVAMSRLLPGGRRRGTGRGLHPQRPDSARRGYGRIRFPRQCHRQIHRSGRPGVQHRRRRRNRDQLTGRQHQHQSQQFIPKRVPAGQARRRHHHPRRPARRHTTVYTSAPACTTPARR